MYLKENINGENVKLLKKCHLKTRMWEKTFSVKN